MGSTTKRVTKTKRKSPGRAMRTAPATVTHEASIPESLATLNTQLHTVALMVGELMDRFSEGESSVGSPNPAVDTSSLVFAALQNPAHRWRTVRGIAKETGLPTSVVKTVLSEQRKNIVRNSRVSQRGEALYTTRERYDHEIPFFDKFVAACRFQVI